MNEVLVVRHSERIDEVDYPLWEQIIAEDTTSRCRRSLRRDPHLTDNGKKLAEIAAETVGSYVSTRNVDNAEVRIYTSKLIRSVQTAHAIARKLNLPLYVCSGLALTAAAVEESNGTFEFASIEQVKTFCPNVEVICCDSSQDNVHHIPTNHWLSAVRAIAGRNESINVIVAHRETIRNLCRKKVSTPYCCLARVTYDQAVTDENPLNAFHVHTVHDMHYNVIKTFERKEDSNGKQSRRRVIASVPFPDLSLV